MSYLPEPNDKQFELAPAGTHLATCYRVIDLGTQTVKWNGTAKHQHKILVTWELPDEKMSDGRPFSVGKRYTWSMSEKSALRPDLESWRGVPFKETDFGPNGFNIKNIIGKSCLVNVAHSESDGKHYANVQSVSKLMKGQTAPPPTNPTVYLWINEAGWDSEVFTKLSDNLKALIMQSPEYHSMLNGNGTPPETENPADGLNDPIPF